MNELSKNQLHYLNMHRRHKRIIVVSRVSILLTFLFLWEFSANTGLIDSFIFSSPSRIALCFLEMTGDGSIFRHIGVTLYETLVSFILVIFFSLFVTVLLWLFRKLSEILEPYLVVLNSLPKSALAPLLIVWLGANRTTIIIAGMSVAIFGSILNLYSEFSEVDPDKIMLIYSSRKPAPCPLQGSDPKLHSGDHQHHEGQYRALSGGRDHRRIYRRQGRTWLYDHLRQSGLQARLAADEHLHPLRDRHAALCSDRTDREVVSLPV